MVEARRFPRGCVASPHYLASSAGLAVLASGGNAVDAAVATSLTLGVVAPYACGFGGDLFAMVWDGSSISAYNGSGRSPGAANLDAVRAAAGSDIMPFRGPLSITVPGAVDGWFTLLERFGTMSFGEVSATALRYARDGFAPTQQGGASFARSDRLFHEDYSASWRQIYAGVHPFETFRQPELARTIEALAHDGPDFYYRGPIGEAIARTVAANGGLMSAADLAAHRGDWVQTVSSTYRGVEIHQMPPNSQGIVALEALNIVEPMELSQPDSVARHHLFIEATKLALADRDAHVTDVGHLRVARDLLASKAWATQRRAVVDRSRAHTPEPGRMADGGTIYLCAADSDGILVSLIQSNFSGFGSGVTEPTWGINLQNRGSYFSLDPEHVNAIAPGKRTMHTLMPALAFRAGEPWLVFGTEGGDGQPQTHLQVLSRLIDDGLDVQQALDAPRWEVSPGDWRIRAESRFEPELLAGLRGLGHDIHEVGSWVLGHAHAIEVTSSGYAAATDPRAEGAALGL